MVTALCGEGIDLSQCLGKQAEEPAGGEETSELTAIDEEERIVRKRKSASDG